MMREFGEYIVKFAPAIQVRNERRLRRFITAMGMSTYAMMLYRAKKTFSDYMLKIKRNITLLDCAHATFHWIHYIQYRFR